MPLLYEWLQRAVADKSAGGGTALVYRDTYLSWRGLSHRVDRRAQELASYGIGAGHWVGLLLGNVPDFVVLALALSKLKAVLAPIDPTIGARDLDMLLEAAPLRAMITRPRGGSDAASNVPPPVSALNSRTKPYQSRFQPESRRRLQGTLLNCNLFKRDMKEMPAGFQPEVVLFTAEPGGDPRGVVRGTGELQAIASSVQSTLDLDSSTRTLAVAPLHHGYAFDFGVVTSLAMGTTLFLDDEMDARRVAKALRDSEIDLFPGTPALYAALAKVVTARPLEVRRPRFLSSGAALSAGIAQAFTQRFQVPVLSCYHSTETGPISVDASGAEPETVGRPFAGVDVQLSATESAPVSDAQTAGGAWVRSAAVTRVFVPTAALASTPDRVPIGQTAPGGWFRTGDRGQRRPDGTLALNGREDDIVKIDGKRVALGEIESCLESLGKVRSAEAHVVVDDDGGTTIVADVVCTGDVRAEELMDHCARHLAPHKVPRQINTRERT